MVITDYRVRSVLRIYSRRLEESKTAGTREGHQRSGEDQKLSETERVSISKDAKQRLLVERVRSQALRACEQ